MVEAKNLARRFIPNDTMQKELSPRDSLFVVQPLDIPRGGTNGTWKMEPKALAFLTQKKDALKEELRIKHERQLQLARIQEHLKAEAEADKADALRDRLRGAFEAHSVGYSHLPKSLKEAAHALPQPKETPSYQERFGKVAGEIFFAGAASLLQFQNETHVRARHELDAEIAGESRRRYAEHTSRNVKINDLRRELPEASFANLVNLAAPSVEEVKKTVEVYYRNIQAEGSSLPQTTTKSAPSIREQNVRVGARLAAKTEQRITKTRIIAASITAKTKEQIGASVRERIKAVGEATGQSLSNKNLHATIVELNQTHPPVAIKGEVFNSDYIPPTELSGAGALLAETIINSNPDASDSNNK